MHKNNFFVINFINIANNLLGSWEENENCTGVQTKPERGKKQYLNNTLLIPLSLHDTTCVEVTHLNDIVGLFV